MSLCFPGQLRIKYPDVTGEFLIVNLTKGGTGLGKLNAKGAIRVTFMKITNVHYTEKQKLSQEAAGEEQDVTLRFSRDSCLKPHSRGQFNKTFTSVIYECSQCFKV